MYRQIFLLVLVFLSSGCASHHISSEPSNAIVVTDYGRIIDFDNGNSLVGCEGKLVGVTPVENKYISPDPEIHYCVKKEGYYPVLFYLPAQGSSKQKHIVLEKVK